MTSTSRKIAATCTILGLAAVGIAATPRTANAQWYGYGYRGYYAPPVVVAPPAAYYPPPPAYYRPPARVWVPAHWRNGYWVPGHWS